MKSQNRFFQSELKAELVKQKGGQTMTSKINMNQHAHRNCSKTGNFQMFNNIERKQELNKAAPAGFKNMKRRARLGENERKEPTKIPT